MDPAEEVLEVILKNSGESFGFSIIGGIDTPMNGKGIFVKSILPGGSAAVDGQLREGDEILRLNGSSLSGLTHFEIMAEFERESRGDLNLSIKRKKKEENNPTNSFENKNKMDRDTLFDFLDHRQRESVTPSFDQSSVPVEISGVKRVVVERLPGESVGLEVEVKRPIGSDGPVHGVFVSHVTPGKAAHRAARVEGGIHVGDEILSVNGTNLSSLGHSEVLQIINEMPLTIEMIIRPRRNDDPNDLNDTGKKGEVSFKVPTNEGKETREDGKDEKREDSRSFIRARAKGTSLPRREVKVASDVNSSSSKARDDVNDASLATDDDSAFYEHPRARPGADGRDTPLSSFILQTRQTSIKHEDFELRKYAFKKRRSDQLGVTVEPYVMGNHRYPKVVAVHPQSFLSRHKLLERGDLLVSYNGLDLKDEASSAFESLVTDGGVVLEDVCLEILRRREAVTEEELNRSSSLPRTFDFLSTEGSRTPSPTKPMRPALNESELWNSRHKCVSRDSGMVDETSSPDGRWGWTPGTESERDDTSRADSPRYGAYFFDERSTTKMEDVSLINFNKLSTEQAYGRRSHSFKPVRSNKRQSSRSRSKGMDNYFSSDSMPNVSDMRGDQDIYDFHRATSTKFDQATSEKGFKPIPMPRKKRAAPDASPTVGEYVRDRKFDPPSIRSEMIEASTTTDDLPSAPTTSIDEEIINDVRLHRQKQPSVRGSNSFVDVPTEDTEGQLHDTLPHRYRPSDRHLVQENSPQDSPRTNSFHRICDVHPTDQKNLLDFVTLILQDPDRLARLSNERSPEGIFRVNARQKFPELGIEMIPTPVGGLVERTDGGVPDIRVGDYILAMNSTPLATMPSTSRLQHFLESIPSSSPVRLLVCQDPQLIANSLSLPIGHKDPLSPSLATPRVAQEAAKDKTYATQPSVHQSEGRGADGLELEFVISNRPVDLGLGHVVEIMGVNTPYTTVIYSEKKEEFATLEDIQCFFLEKTFPDRKKHVGIEGEQRDRTDSFDEDMLLDGTRCGFVSRQESFKRRFKGVAGS